MLNEKLGVQIAVREALKGLDIEGDITLPMAAEADLAGGADLGDVIAKVNAVLAKLRTAGLLGV